MFVRVQVPDVPKEKIPDQTQHALALVIDISSSLAGQPLAYVIHCAHIVVGRLWPVDSVAPA